MKKKVRCKACGFLMTEGEFDACPACGVPSKMFEPYEDKVPENRRRILDLDIHPVIVHAPQGITFVLLILGVLEFILKIFAAAPDAIVQLLATIHVLSIVLPIVVLFSITSGMFDAKFRYKTRTAKLLVRKILVGTLFLIISVAMLLVVFSGSFDTQTGMQFAFLVLNLGAFLCTIILGLWGARLIKGEMGGPFTKKKKPVKGSPAAPAAPGAPAAPAGE